jgi:phosphoribosylanthranilate isomerase
MNSAFVPIKICGLTRESDVDAAVQMGVQAVGFVVWPHSPRAISAARAAELARRLPAFVSPVLLFVNPSESEVRQACDLVPGAWLQFHGDETPEFCAQWAQTMGRRWIRAARIPQDPKAGFDLVKYAQDHSQADALLLDTLVSGYGGSGQSFNWSLLPPSVNAHLVLSGGLTPANVADGLRALRGRGRSLSVDVSSGVESAKGIKDPHKMLAFVQAVRQACTL